jgi:glycosyltransferase involved in cell wall biosynthesis
MRIAIDTLFEHPDHPTGSIDYLRNVASTFPRIAPQHEYFLLVSGRNIRYFREFERTNLRFIDCLRSNENTPLRIFIQQTLVPFEMKRHKIDALFAPGNVCPFWGNICCVLKINTLHHYHAPNLIGRTRAIYRRFVFEQSARRADRILANTLTTKEEICRLMRIPEQKVTVTGEAFYDIYTPLSEDQTKPVLAKHRLRRDYVLFLSSLYRYKNVDTLIKSFAYVLQQKPSDTELVIVGQDFDSQLPRLQALSRSLGISNRVRFLGFVPTEDIPAIYSGANVFVFPSLIETFGKPLVEAMRCGIPIVASNASCIPEVLGGAGLLVNPLDLVEMGCAIARAISDPELRKDLIARGLRRAESFSWENAAKSTLAEIERSFRDWKRSQGEVTSVDGSN